MYPNMTQILHFTYNLGNHTRCTVQSS